MSAEPSSYREGICPNCLRPSDLECRNKDGNLVWDASGQSTDPRDKVEYVCCRLCNMIFQVSESDFPASAHCPYCNSMKEKRYIYAKNKNGTLLYVGSEPFSEPIKCETCGGSGRVPMWKEGNFPLP